MWDYDIGKSNDFIGEWLMLTDSSLIGKQLLLRDINMIGKQLMLIDVSSVCVHAAWIQP